MGRRSTALRIVAVLAFTAACSNDSDEPSSRLSAATSTTTASTAPTTTGAPAAASVTTTTTKAAAPTTTTRRSSSPATTAAPGPAPTASPTTAPSSAPGPTTTAAPPTTTASSPSGQAAITIQNFSFNPAVLNVGRGTTVTATNLDSATHTWTSDNRSWDSGNLGQNGRSSHTFVSPGTFTYHCEIHPSMKGTVNVS